MVQDDNSKRNKELSTLLFPWITERDSFIIPDTSLPQRQRRHSRLVSILIKKKTIYRICMSEDHGKLAYLSAFAFFPPRRLCPAWLWSRPRPWPWPWSQPRCGRCSASGAAERRGAAAGVRRRRKSPGTAGRLREGSVRTPCPDGDDARNPSSWKRTAGPKRIDARLQLLTFVTGKRNTTLNWHHQQL